MIGVCDVEIQAANPTMPLFPLRAYLNSPSSLRVRNVPKKVGEWRITNVQIAVAYPDNTIKTAECKLIGSVWVGTVAGSSASGTSENGYTVYASGIDENGDEVHDYVLGKGLVEILTTDGTITPSVDTAYVHLFSEQPANPKEGDMWPDANGGFVVWQDGEAMPLGITQAEVADLIDGRLAGYVQRGEFDNFIVEVDDDFNDVNNELTTINSLIPNQATSQNQLADKAFVNSSVQTATANFRGNWATWAAVPSTANVYPPDYTGSRTPTVNDYMVVQDAWGFGGPETQGTWRFKYSGVWATNGKGGWLAEYQVNETPMTAAQVAALNSNITAAKVAYYDSTLSGLEELIESI